MTNLTKNYHSSIAIIENNLSPFLLLSIRVFIGLVFLKSGLAKFANIDSAILLFEYEYQVPIISPIFGAYSSMFFEIFCGISLIAGFLARLSSLPLIAITLVIQFLVFENQEHFYWLFLLFTILIYGSGKISCDAILSKFFKAKN